MSCVHCTCVKWLPHAQWNNTPPASLGRRSSWQSEQVPSAQARKRRCLGCGLRRLLPTDFVLLRLCFLLVKILLRDLECLFALDVILKADDDFCPRCVWRGGRITLAFLPPWAMTSAYDVRGVCKQTECRRCFSNLYRRCGDRDRDLRLCSRFDRRRGGAVTSQFSGQVNDGG